jgi:hypothetical protein
MKISYKGFDIECTKERALGGWISIYYGVYRQSDGYELNSGFCTDDSVPVRQYIKEELKPFVDRFLLFIKDGTDTGWALAGAKDQYQNVGKGSL